MRLLAHIATIFYWNASQIFQAEGPTLNTLVTEPVIKHHLSWKTTFLWHMGWSFKTGSTVFICTYYYQEHIIITWQWCGFYWCHVMYSNSRHGILVQKADSFIRDCILGILYSNHPPILSTRNIQCTLFFFFDCMGLKLEPKPGPKILPEAQAQPSPNCKPSFQTGPSPYFTFVNPGPKV